MQTKKKVLKLRSLNKKHGQLIKNMLSNITKCDYQEILPGKLYGQYGGPYVEVFSIPQSLWERVKRIMGVNLNPYSAGLYVATIKKEEITPSLDLAKQIARKCRLFEYRHAIVSDKGEQVFLYGKDVFKENILEYSPSEGFLIVINRNKEPLGWGFLKMRDGKELLIENIKDVGWYVRSGG
jgi:ribosome biogenesis protein Nip4